jgi:hypothetical protein
MLIVESLVMPIDASELVEALAILRVWDSRVEELPAHLRAQVQRVLQAFAPEELVDIQRGRETVVALKPEVRAVLANLRALEA